MSAWEWTCSDDACDFANEVPSSETEIASLLLSCVEHEDTHPGHLILTYRVPHAVS